jgi:predicted RNA-binding protein
VLRISAVAASFLALVTTAMLVKSPAPTPGREAATGDVRTAVDELTAASRGLEAVLRDPALRRQVLSPRRAAVIVDLEDRIAAVDMVLADQQSDRGDVRNVALWSHRVELLDALVAARAGTLDDEGVVYAVFQSEGSQP